MLTEAETQEGSKRAYLVKGRVEIVADFVDLKKIDAYLKEAETPAPDPSQNKDRLES